MVNDPHPTQYFPPQEPGDPAAAHEQYVHPEVTPARRSFVGPVIAALALLAVVAAAAVGWLVMRDDTGAGSGPVTSTYTSTVQAEPDTPTQEPADQGRPTDARVPAQAIPANDAARQNAPTGDFNSVWRGTEVTSEPFALAVRDEFVRHYLDTGETEAELRVRSSVTGQTYTMTCRDDGAVVTCSGGNNAIVHIS